jgi:hypothetical protein
MEMGMGMKKIKLLEVATDKISKESTTGSCSTSCRLY